MSGLKDSLCGDDFYVPPYQRHSSTSHAAARSIAGHTKSAEQRVLAFLRSRPQGATDEQIDEAERGQFATLRPRRIKLVQDGFVRDSGRTDRTKANRLATVWEAT